MYNKVMIKFLPLHTFILAYIAVISVLVFNISQLQNPYIGFVLGVLYLALSGFICGTLFLRKENFYWKNILGFLFFLSLIIIVSSIFFYLYNLAQPVIILIVTLLASVLIVLYYVQGKKHASVYPQYTMGHKLSTMVKLLVASFVFLEGTLFFILLKSATSEAIRSPWWNGIVPIEFFAIYFLASLVLAAITLYGKKNSLSLFLIVIHFLISTSIALIIYKVGYGFDPFIHQASEKIIAQSGTLSPKPLYYIGQYTLVVVLAKIFSISVIHIDKFLIPILFSVFSPLVLYYSLKKTIGKNSYIVLTTLLLLAIGYNTFIVTTPQALANFFSLITILLSVIYDISSNW